LIVFENNFLMFNDDMKNHLPYNDPSEFPEIRLVRKENMRRLEKEAGSRKALAEKMGVDYTQITNWLSPKAPRNIGENMARRAELAMKKPRGWLDRVEGYGFAVLDAKKENSEDIEPPNASRAPYSVAMAVSDDDSYEIPFYQVKGDCGSGIDNSDPYEKGMLRKEHDWFKKYGVHPDHVACIYASGNSMQPYLLEGDMVFIDTRPTDPVSGEAYLINHPDGERIKRLRRTIDGSWVISSDNPDKAQHPDETVTPAHADQIRIIGRVFYRQG
jgi:phage repressor protein C with HTH and peptisase S24 domain